MNFSSWEEARQGTGVRLVIADGFPSPWSQAALELLTLRGAPHTTVRFRPERAAIARDTGIHNAPVLLVDAEPARTGWAEIACAVDRLGDGPPLLPAHTTERVAVFGLGHELLGEDGLVWSVRLALIHASIETEGREGWPAPVAAFLAPKYGYRVGGAEAAKERARAVLSHLDGVLAASRGPYLLGDNLTAVDVWVAVSTALMVPFPHDLCPMLAPVRHAVETLDPTIRAAVTDRLLAHRDRMYERHLTLPMRF